MFDELLKYTLNGHFFFNPTDDLKKVCNAPTYKTGVYLVYTLHRGRIELVFIGDSGSAKPNTTKLINKKGLWGNQRKYC